MLRLVAGLGPATDGNISQDGATIARLNLSRIVMFQDPTLYPWLRGRGLPGKTGWTESDLLCRSGGAAVFATPSTLPVGGMGALIAGMDAERVRYVKGGFVH